MSAAAGRSGRQAQQNRGEESRQRLIEAALDIFGANGFDGASTRMLAERAGVNLAAIPYYFGGKEGLYHAVAEHIAAFIGERISPVLNDVLPALQAEELSRQEAFDHLLRLLDAFAALLIGAPEADRLARFIIREQMDPTPAFDALYEGVMKRVHGVFTTLIAHITDQPKDDPAVAARAFTIMGQVLVFRTARAAVFRRMGWRRFTPDRLKLIQSIIRKDVAASLGVQGVGS